MINQRYEVYLLLSRSNDESFAKKLLSEASYERGENRRIVSLKMCVISWLLECVGLLSMASITLLHTLGLHNIHYPDCIIMNVIIPIVYLMNDEETKGIIAEEGWYQGIRYMLGTYNRVRRHAEHSTEADERFFPRNRDSGQRNE